MQQSYKPGSVFSTEAENSCHFSKRPTPRHKRVAFIRRYTWPFTPQDKQLQRSPVTLVGSYPTFSPLLVHQSGRAVFFFFVTLPSRSAVFQQCGTLCCPDFPLFRQKTAQRQDQLLQNFIEPYKINYFCGLETYL